MGYGIQESDTHKCFNSAKMFELEWYNDRVVSIDPARNGDSFHGKVIGVADYGASNNDHALVLEVKDPNPNKQNIYLTYNRAKGIQADTGEYADKVTIVRGGAGEQSWMFASLDVASLSTHTITDYYNGRDLFISVQSVGTDATVDYAMVKVELEVENCAIDADCSVDTRGCWTAMCNELFKCVYEPVQGCCGNSICEPEVGENCGSCSEDCIKPDDCNDLGYYLGGCTGAQVTANRSGNMFDIEAKQDATIFAFEIRVYGDDPIQPEIYIKKGTWRGMEHESLAWTQILGDVTIPVVSDGSSLIKTNLQLPNPVFMKAGETVAFYITLNEPARQWYRVAYNVDSKTWDAIGDLVEEDDYLRILAGSANEYPFGSFDGPNRFIGRPKYAYGSVCYSDDMCDDQNVYTHPDTCDVLTHECHNPPESLLLCGNKVCEPWDRENCGNCPSDCYIPLNCNELGWGANPFDTWYLNSQWTFSSHVHGNMFDIEAKTDITIYGLKIFMYQDTDTFVDVWTKKGSYVGAEHRPVLWTKVMDSTRINISNNMGIIQFVSSLQVSAGSVQSFHVKISESFRLYFSHGTGVGNVVKEDDNIRIYEGVGTKTKDSNFSEVSLSPIQFRGIFLYEYGNLCYHDDQCDDLNPYTIDQCSNVAGSSAGGSCTNQPEVGICGNTLCEQDTPFLESWFTCPQDCERPNSATFTVGSSGEGNSYSYGPRTGAMFDLETYDDSLTIFGFDCATTSAAVDINVQFFITRLPNTSFVGKERDQSQWMKISDQTLSFPSSSTLHVSLDFPIRLEAHSIRGVYVVFGSTYGALAMYSGTAVGHEIASSDHLKIMEGSWNNHSFGTFVTPWRFNAKANYFLSWSCSTSADCNDNNDITEDVCVQGQCQYSAQSGVCGNGICEPTNFEFCNTCPEDCTSPNDCNEISFFSSSTSSSSAVYGIMFDIESTQDITLLEVQVTLSAGSYTLKLYSKEGSYVGSEFSAVDWTVLFESSVSVQNGIPYAIPLSVPAPIAGGTQHAFYLSVDKSFVFAYNGGFNVGDIVIENSDMKIFAGRTNGANFGSFYPYSGYQKFLGKIKYNYGLVECFDEHCGNEVSTMPTSYPSDSPSDSPSEASSDLPSKAASDAPSTEPSPATPTCSDPLTSFLFKMNFPNGNSGWKTCTWISENPRRCKVSGIGATCRSSCGTCGVCVDSPYEFKFITNGKLRNKSCGWVSKSLNRCRRTGVAEACPKTCGLCN